MIINLCNYYVITLIISIVLGKVLLYGVNGIVLSLCLGTLLAIITYIIFVIFSLDLKKYNENTLIRIEEDTFIFQEIDNMILYENQGQDSEESSYLDEEMCKINTKPS